MKVKVFKIAILTFWASTVLGVTLMLVLEGTLPLPLVEYIESTNHVEFSTTDIVVGLLSLVVLLIGLYSSIGLYRLNEKSRKTFAGVNVLMLVLSPLYGPVVIDGYSYALNGLTELSAGFIIAMSYMTNVLEINKTLEEKA